MSKVVTDKARIEQLLSRGVEEVIVREHLEAALMTGKQLRVKFGIDPTAPDLHLGHSVPLRKLRQFQNLGHKAVLIIGDYTARIGDPSGKDKKRIALTAKEVTKNMKDYLRQASQIIDITSAEIRYNSDWLEKMSFKDTLELLSRFTVQQFLEREDFSKRIAAHKPLWASEMTYPALQAYDSVKVRADLEIGGTDQKFNLLAGRSLMESYKMEAQDVMTLPLLVGTDGVHKMSKTLGNYIGITESPNAMFGKIMSIPDALIDQYRMLCTDLPAEALAKEGPREAKLALGEIIVDMYHGKGEGVKAREEFVRVFTKHEKPADIPEVKVGSETLTLVNLLVAVKAAKSKSEARRLIKQGGVWVDDERQSDPEAIVDPVVPKVLRVGPRKFYRVVK